MVQDKRHEGSQTRTKVLQVDDGRDGRDGEGFPGQEALGTGCGGWWVGVSIKKTWRASQIITDKGRAVGNAGSCPGNGENGEKAEWEASRGSFACQAEAFASDPLSSGSHRKFKSWERHQNWGLGRLIQRPHGEGSREIENQ